MHTNNPQIDKFNFLQVYKRPEEDPAADVGRLPLQRPIKRLQIIQQADQQEGSQEQEQQPRQVLEPAGS